MAGSTVDLRTEVDPALLGGLTVQIGDRLLDASIRGRLERLRDQLNTGRPAAHADAPLRRPNGDAMAIRSDEIISIIKSQIESFDATTETRSVGTVVEVGDGIAQIYGLDAALASELLEFPGGVMGMALNLEEETVGAVILGDAVGDQGGRPGPDHRPRRRGPRRPGAARPGRGPARQRDRRQGRHPAHEDPPGRAHRARRHHRASRSTRRSRPASRPSTP